MQEFFDWFVQQAAHVIEVNPTTFVQRDEQRFLRRTDSLDGLPVVDFTIEDVPLEEGIALLYQRKESVPVNGSGKNGSAAKVEAGNGHH